MAPVGQFVTLTKTYGPEILSRFNLFSTISVNASVNEGYSSGDTIIAEGAGLLREGIEVTMR